MFISSASGALTPYRQAAVDVCRRLGMTPVHMEQFDPQRPPPSEVCRERLNTCDVFVLLLAHRYGSRPRDSSLSYTELEYQWAVDRPNLPILPFVVDSTFAWPPPDIDQGADAQELARFRDRVTRGHVVKRFTELATFREDLILALRPFEPSGPAATDRDDQASTGLPAPPALHAVPPYVGSAPFTGRAADLTHLDDWGRSADPVLVVEAIGGTGKSALTWEWAAHRAGDAIEGLAGQLWWSFYDGSPSMTSFLREVLAYTTRRPLAEIRRLSRSDLTAQVLAALRSRPYLIVLDGFERLLRAYHNFDPSKVQDDEVDASKRSMIDPQAEDVLRELTAVGPSMVLISTRLLPDALRGRFGQPLPGVRQIRLPGLTGDDTIALLGRLGVHGTNSLIDRFFRRLDNHPLLIGIVVGLVRDYRPEPGGFDRWLADPAEGGALTLPHLDLTQRRTHILAAALANLSPGSHRLLSWISVLSGAVDWTTIEAINPFRPSPPEPIKTDLSSLGPRPRPSNPFDYSPPGHVSDYQTVSQRYDEAGDPREESERSALDHFEAWDDAATRLRADAARETEKQLAAWQNSEAVSRAKAQLDLALKDLEERGLLWWDRAANSYDLHPIIRAHVHDQLGESDRVQANTAVRDHFEALPPEDATHATSVEDLRQTITIFRALVGAHLFDDASTLWTRAVGDTLLVTLGASATVVELLTPLASHGSLSVRGDLTLAYTDLERFEEAIENETTILASKLDEENAGAVQVSLSRLSSAMDAGGRWAISSRIDDLRRDLSAARGDGHLDRGVIFDDAISCQYRGELAAALKLVDQAERTPGVVYNPWFESNVKTARLVIALLGRTLIPEQLAAAAEDLDNMRTRITFASIQVRYHIWREDFSAALSAAERHERLARDIGRDSTPAFQAFLLAKLGRHIEARVAVDETLARLPRLHPARRPQYFLALALRELGAHEQAIDHAREAYRHAWGDGPPHHYHWGLRDARELLAQLGEPPPNLPKIDPATIKAPLENEIRAFIAKLNTERSSAPAHHADRNPRAVHDR